MIQFVCNFGTCHRESEFLRFTPSIRLPIRFTLVRDRRRRRHLYHRTRARPPPSPLASPTSSAAVPELASSCL
uniref:Uncharacterized protein n=1 Tax=Oryza barthii TaxID=65489 RepID=A0A0D3GID2_9ORYZ